ncbi:hypothetical protein KKD03_04485 [Patescibacteria group bacterium]|nr:hypothetical protein [Patescibacteria group bacterium]
MYKIFLTLGTIVIAIPAILTAIVLTIIPLAKRWNRVIESISSQESGKK